MVFLNNIAGCFLYFQQQKENSWVANVVENQPKDFIIMKFNASVYTFMDDTEMEIVNKNIEIENKIYYVFKKQIKNNILTLYCLPNKSISETAVNISKIINNDFETKPNLSRKGLEKAYKIFDKDYVTNDLYEKEFLVLFLNQKPTSDFTFQNNILKGFLFKDILPPKNSIA